MKERRRSLTMKSCIAWMSLSLPKTSFGLESIKLACRRDTIAQAIPQVAKCNVRLR